MMNWVTFRVNQPNERDLPLHHSVVCTVGRRVVATAAVGGICFFGLSCSSSADRAAENAEGYGRFQVTATVEEVMRSIIDPAADAVWDSVVIVSNESGIQTTQPETDEDWLTLRRHAITLVEASNLLLMDGRAVAAPESRSELPGIDLEPDEIEALLAADRTTWSALVSKLHESGIQVLNAVDTQDVDALLVAGDRLDLACENCHGTYWYPGYGGRADEGP
jgi:hypothetical protein